MAFQHIRIKNTNIPGKVPGADKLDVAELCVNLKDHKLFSKDADSNIFEVGLADAPSDSTLYGRKDQGWEAIPAAATVYWSLSGSDLYPTNPSYNVGLGGTQLSPNIVLTAAGAGTFAGDVNAVNLTASGNVDGVNLTATGTVEGSSLVATGGGFSGTAVQVSGSVSAGSYRIDLLNTLP